MMHFQQVLLLHTRSHKVTVGRQPLEPLWQHLVRSFTAPAVGSPQVGFTTGGSATAPWAP